MNKSGIVTGANSGIGLATARQLVQRGWRVIGVGLGRAADEAFSFHALDLTQPDAASALVDPIDKLDALVNCAGINLPSVIEGLTVETLRQQMAVNVEAPLRLIQACLPLLRASQGRIVNVSSIMGEVAMPTLGAYSMSKHALEAMSDALRLELAGQGVRVSVVQMGAVRTPMTDAMADVLTQAESSHATAVRALYARLYTHMRASLTQQAASAIPPERVAAVIVRALESPQPRPRYRVDAAAAGLSLMRRLAPEQIGDIFLRRALRLS
ncbi:SDR family NAD(P)-dependent oxidoreductase [Aggregatilineales bacterium SYSU G02658]